jgi:hypothetical protein
MVFALTSVANEHNARRFTFELTGSGQPRTTVVVAADLELARKYEIPLQELPLLCLRLLEGWTAGTNASIVFAEKEMIEYANRRSRAKDLAEQKRRAHWPRKPNSGVDA